MARLVRWGWIVVAVGLCALTVPWFLWGDATVVAGIPLWLWWHIGWMGLAALVFRLFARRAWGLGIESGAGSSDGSTPPNAGVDPGGERR